MLQRGRYYALLVTTLLVATTAVAQRQQPYGEIGAAVGGMNYIGDLNEQSLFGKVCLAASLHFRYNLDSRWAFTATAGYGTLSSGDNDKLEWRNLSFRSRLWEGNIRAELNFVSFGLGEMSYRTTPFIFVGIGVFGYDPEAKTTDTTTGESRWVKLRPLGTEGQYSETYPDRKPYSHIAVSIPFGVGFKAQLTRRATMSIEYGVRKTWTDYIDDVSTTYVDPSDLANDPMSLPLSDRSNPRNPVGTMRGDDTLDDWYAYFNISLSINAEVFFGWTKRKRCNP